MELQRFSVSQECLILCPEVPHGSSISKTQVNIRGKGSRTQLLGWHSHKPPKAHGPHVSGLSCPLLGVRWGHGTPTQPCSRMEPTTGTQGESNAGNPHRTHQRPESPKRCEYDRADCTGTTHTFLCSGEEDFAASYLHGNPLGTMDCTGLMLKSQPEPEQRP